MQKMAAKLLWEKSCKWNIDENIKKSRISLNCNDLTI